jgi:hypothetical protein
VSTSEKSQLQRAGAGAAAQERREYPRYSFSASVEAVHLETNTRLSGRASDLGRGGCYVDTISPFPVGASVKIQIVKDHASFLALGRVLYATTGMGMGLAFTKIEPERLRVLEDWLRELSGESAPAAGPIEDDFLMASAAGSAGNEQRNVLNELIVMLIRKQVLTDEEGKALMKRLME